MSDLTTEDLSGIAATLLLPLYVRALESQRPDALLKDEKAVALVKQMGGDFAQFERAQVNEETRVAVILRNREFDCLAEQLPASSVVIRVLTAG
jgi:O-methyltransferase involved in polyketide biosynthesis